MVELGLKPGFLIPGMVSVSDATVLPEKSSFLFPSLISTPSVPSSGQPLPFHCRNPTDFHCRNLPWEPVPWASGLLLPPPHDPHLGGLLAAPPSSFDICGFQMSISSTCFVFLVPWADSMEEGGGRGAPRAQGHMLVAMLCSGPNQPLPLAGWQLLSSALVLEEPGVGHRQGWTCPGLD